MISVNKVYSDLINNRRIRIIKIEDDIVYVVNIDTLNAIPEKLGFNYLENQIILNEILEITDPYAIVVLDKNLSEIEIKIREEN